MMVANKDFCSVIKPMSVTLKLLLRIIKRISNKIDKEVNEEPSASEKIAAQQKESSTSEWLPKSTQEMQKAICLM